ncbi:hypothetical protein GCM10025331_75390 [Actinoplanes utahensis]|nr:hypothetical protein Aut01nite_43220 [Actinoplanes utahensis]
MAGVDVHPDTPSPIAHASPDAWSRLAFVPASESLKALTAKVRARKCDKSLRNSLRHFPRSLQPKRASVIRTVSYR